MRILIVEDHGPTRDLLVRTLEAGGAASVTAARISTGLQKVHESEFDVIILDLMLPDGDGLDFCRRIRAEGIGTPVLCLTARADVADRVQGLDAGADDYLRKPFALAELRARIRALGRRHGQAPIARITAGSTRIDFTARKLERRGESIPLTAREWEVLEALVARSGRIVSRADLLESIWHDAGPACSDSLDVILSRLRRKLGNPEDGCAIRTVRGAGLVFETKR